MTEAVREYADGFAHCTLATAEAEFLQGRLAGPLNAAVECCERWAGAGGIALDWLGRDFTRESVTFAELADSSRRFAHLLKARGIGRGDVVAGLLPRIPELLTVILGTWRAGAVYQPLFTAFGPKAIEQRVAAPGGSQAKLIVTDVANRPKLAEIAAAVPVLLVDRGREGAGDFAAALAAQPAHFDPVPLGGDDPFVVIFTSGTTGPPKGVLYPLKLLLPVGVYMRDAIDLRPADRYWNVADPGWAYGMLYAIMGPLLLGHATSFFEGPFAVDSTVRVIETLGITNLAAAPTAYRLLMAAGDAALAPIAGRLRVASSAGEPLNPELARWAERALHCPLYDHYGQTELAMLVNNHHALRHRVKPGAAGLPMPGFAMAILDDDLNPVPANQPGVLCVHRPSSPLFCFDGYWRADSPNLRGEWYVTGDTMLKDEDGFYFFVGRNDDIITSAGYRIGPFDVESAIIEHPAVAEVAVIGKPDPERTEIVKAFIVLRAGHEASDALAAEIQQHVRTRLSAHAYPREIAFLPELPKTPSGKVQRFILRGRG